MQHVVWLNLLFLGALRNVSFYLNISKYEQLDILAVMFHIVDIIHILLHTFGMFVLTVLFIIPLVLRPGKKAIHYLKNVLYKLIKY